MATAYSVLNDFTVVPTPHRVGEVSTVRAEFSLSAALVINDTIAMVKVPANHVITDMVLTTDDLDTNVAPAITLDVGIVGGDTDQFFAASTVAQAGGVERPSVKTAYRDVATASDRTVQVLVKAAPATGATEGKINLQVSYQAQ